jgi:flagellar hook-associated protein 3 FlgL
MDAIRTISTSALREIPKQAIARLEAQAAKLQVELATGRPSDVGLHLGARSGTLISLRGERARLDTIKDANGIVAARLEGSQAALSAIVEDTQAMLSATLAAQGSAPDPDILVGQAKSKLTSLVQLLGASVDGVSLFSGINTDSTPLDDYFASPSPDSRRAVEAAFVSEFGFTQSDPNVQGITASQMRNFLAGSFETLFDDVAWANDWSAASDKTLRSRISTSEMIETSVSANGPAIRDLARAYVMIADLGGNQLSESAMAEVYGTAAKLIGGSIAKLGELQGKIGIAQERVSHANERMGIEAALLEKNASALDFVDPAEISAQLSNVMSQIELAYALTARIHRLSLLEFI